MGLGIYPVFDPPLTRVTFGCDGTSLARHFESLDAIARAIGIRTFSSFGDTRVVPVDFDGSPDDWADVMGTWDEWFSPVDGLRVVEAILNAFAESVDEAEKLRGSTTVEAELIKLEACLSAAVESGSRFRLEIG